MLRTLHRNLNITMLSVRLRIRVRVRGADPAGTDPNGLVKRRSLGVQISIRSNMHAILPRVRVVLPRHYTGQKSVRVFGPGYVQSRSRHVSGVQARHAKMGR